MAPTKKAQGGAFENLKSALTNKDNRRLLIGGGLLIIILLAVVINVILSNGDSDDAVSQEPSGPVEVTVAPSTPTGEAEPTNNSTAPSSGGDPVVISERADAPANPPPPRDFTEEELENLTPDDIPPGNPENRGGLPEEFPLVDSYQYTGMEEEDDRIIINGTVDDSNEAIWVLDGHLANEYTVTFRKVDNNRTAGRYHVHGPSLPEDTVISVRTDGTFQVRVPKVEE